MLKFKPLELGDQELFTGFLKDYPFKTYEYSFLTLYLWKDYCRVEYAILEDALIIKKSEENKGSYFMQPIGYVEHKLPGIITELNHIKEQEAGFKTLFRDIEEPFLEELRELYGPRLQAWEDVNNFDYIYQTQKLIELKGDKLHKKKNHYNQFIHAYNYVVKDIRESGVATDCLRFSEKWLQDQAAKHRELIFELRGIEDILQHLAELPFCGLAVYVGEKIVGYTLAEIVNRQMAIVHIEKGNTRYKGIYAFLNKTLAETYLRDTLYINREEDLGLSNLRKAKLAYDPERLEKKYIVDLG